LSWHGDVGTSYWGDHVENGSFSESEVNLKKRITIMKNNKFKELILIYLIKISVYLFFPTNLNWWITQC
jgi:hypothetical protein